MRWWQALLTAGIAHWALAGCGDAFSAGTSTSSTTAATTTTGAGGSTVSTSSGGGDAVGGSGGATGGSGGCPSGVSNKLEHGSHGPSCGDGLDCDGESCCANTLIKSGSFQIGRSEDGCDAFEAGALDEQPEHEATVAEFYLDKYEVSVGRFRKFVDAYDGTPPQSGAGAHPLISGSGWDSKWDSKLPATKVGLTTALKCVTGEQTWASISPSSETRAINCVSWFEAFAFCVWDGGRLPTAAEWERAAVGGADNRLYPWGSAEPDATLVNSNATAKSPFYAVGSLPAGAGRWGQHALAGGMWEWTLDWYLEGWYAPDGPGNPCDNCASLGGDGVCREFRGGSWAYDNARLRGAGRYPSKPTYRGSFVGIRCARTP